jgi:hypothetical protein
METVTPGASPQVPLYMKIVHTDQKLDVGKIVLLLGVTVISGYLASQSQRAGSDADFAKTLRMRYHLGCQKAAVGQAKFWTAVAEHHHDLYEIVKL